MEHIDTGIEHIRKVKHDLRAPLINIQGFASEIAGTCADVTALVEHHHNTMPREFDVMIKRLMNEDLIPCLDYLEKSVELLDRRIKMLASQDAADNKGYQLKFK